MVFIGWVCDLPVTHCDKLSNSSWTFHSKLDAVKKLVKMQHRQQPVFLREASNANQYRACERTHHVSADEASEATIVQRIIEGQFSRPIKVVAFNTEQGWSRDVTQEIATKLLDLNRNGVALSAAAREFVERVMGQPATAIV